MNGLIEGREALSSYMGGFQQSVKGGKFEIRSVMHHHDRMLAEWKLIGGDGIVLQTGRSFATASADGRLQNITGFFDSGLKEPIRRAIRPRAGHVVLFPSYKWHGTIPFRSEYRRQPAHRIICPWRRRRCSAVPARPIAA